MAENELIGTIPTVSIPQMIDIVCELSIKRGHALMFWGSPGCGKTEGIRQAADKSGAYLVDFRTALYDSVDMHGLPHNQDGTTAWLRPRTLPFVGNEGIFPSDKPILLFLDEINAGSRATEPLTMQLVQEHGIGDHKLMSNVSIVAAGNRESDRGVANRMSTTQANRLAHYEIVVDTDAYCAYRQRKGGLPVETAFYSYRPALLNTFDPGKPDKAFATPRSSEEAWTLYADEDLPESLKRDAFASRVGKGVMLEAFGFVDVWHKVVPISVILANPAKAALPEEASMQYATAVSVSHAMTKDNADALNTYLDRMPPQFCVLGWRLAVQRDEQVARADAFLKMGKKHKAIFA